MLSNVCILNVWFTLVNLSTSFFIFSINSLPIKLCDLFTSHARFIYTCSLVQLAIRQVIKYVYIVHWKYIKIIDDEFVVRYVFLWSLLSSSIFNIFLYIFGHSNSVLNYHYCTGVNHNLNVQNAIAHLKSHGNITLQHVWIQNQLKSDPLGALTFTLLSLLVVCSVLTWLNKRSKKLKHLFKKVFQFKKGDEMGNLADSHFDPETSLEKQSKIFDLEAGQIITIIVIAAICFFPLLKVVTVSNENENYINSGVGKMWVYVSHICLVFLFYNIFPAQIILNNPRMMKSILREFKDSTLGRKIWIHP